MRIIRVMLMLFAVLFSTGTCYAQALELGGFLIALGQVRTTLEETINTVDAETAARLRQTQIILDQTIKQLDDVIKNGFDQANNTREKVYSNITDTIQMLQSDLADKGYIAFLGINSSLVNAARITDGIPFFQVETFLFASEPMRIKPKAIDRLLSIYGYFPDVDTDHPAVINIEGTKLKTSQFIGNRLSVEIPPHLLETGERFINFEVAVPVKRWFGIRWPEKFKGRIYVEREQPFKFSISENRTNSELWHTISAPNPYVQTADSNHTSNIGSATAPNLASILINDDIQYDLSTAKFSQISHTVQPGNIPCPCCTSPSGQLNSWDASTVSWQLNAPTCNSQWCNVGHYCGGGGTDIRINITPTFLIKRRNVADEVVASNSSLEMKRLSVSQPITLGEWTSLDVIGEFRDGDEYYTDHIHLTSGVRTGNSRYWVGEVSGQNLMIQTR